MLISTVTTMTIIYAAATAVVNPPGVEPFIGQNQLWEALELKRTQVQQLNKQPQRFLAVIDTCKVLEDRDDTILREVKFKDGGGEFTAPIIGKTIQERVTHRAPVSSTSGAGVEIFNVVGNASRVLNIVSTGASPGELYLTFTFEWDHPEIERGSAEELTKQIQYQTSAPAGLAGTLVRIREMAKAGELGRSVLPAELTPPSLSKGCATAPVTAREKLRSSISSCWKWFRFRRHSVID
ncbi:DUF1857-domain-containing protein [Venturia nashicola]|uniref:DUF1857-domain-containing protein n=1 Tax=Venturia nashicola TaxID=86259 RepID=A0A4Z1PF69_9PEZI|nr:DUF1857-domain-containing protein [Venturia nashicola]TLD38256.1 DUF1857-domain-containing protein [Venturia nashicola]